MKPSINRRGGWASRRRALKAMAVLLALPALPAAASAPPPAWKRLAPRLKMPATVGATAATATFAPDEARMLVRLAETIVPGDGTPGARETDSGAFVVYSLQNEGEATVAGIRQGLAALDQLAIAHFGGHFNELPQPALDALAGILAGESAFAPFWHGVRSLTVFHHYAMPAGYLAIGLPGPNIDRGGFPRPRLVPCLRPA